MAPEHEPVEFVPLSRYSEVHSQDDLVRFLRTRINEKVKRVKDLEGELKTAQSREQLANDREDFLLNELAAQVSDLDCNKFRSSPVLFQLLHDAVSDSFVQVSKIIQPKNIGTLKRNFKDWPHIARLPSGPTSTNHECC